MSTTAVKFLAATVLLAFASSAVAGVHYVDVNSTNATPPYTNWTTAATNIQDAVDAAVAGDEIVVANGIYATGGRATVGDSTTNRVAVDKPLSLRSINGPQFTSIDGRGGSRCVRLSSGASLSGFTLRNGYADNGYGGAGVSCQSRTEVVSNCVVSGNHAIGGYGLGLHGGGAYGGTLNNCTLTGNSATTCNDCSGRNEAYGGGAYNSTLNNCTLSGNSAIASGYVYATAYAYGGGAYGCTLSNCTLAGNSATVDQSRGPAAHALGGGAQGCTLINCTLSGNSAWEDGGGAYSWMVTNCTLSSNSVVNRFSGPHGGGALYSTLNNCTLTGNSGSGARGCTLKNCTLTGNSSYGAYGSTLNNCALTGNGGGAYYSTLNNCTLTGNSGYGADECKLTNCIAYFNHWANYDFSSTLNYCCTTPLPATGIGNISSDPQLASSSHLSIFSPCIGKGNYAAVSGVDIDGEPWANPPSMGCDEYHAGAVTGPLSVGITASFTNVAVGFPVDFTASIEGRTDLSAWTFGDGALEINQPYAVHSWSAPGDYLVSLWCFNDSYPGGISSSVTVHVVTSVHYVAADSPNPVAPYASWATAATNIQDAVDAAVEPGAVVVVTNGFYATGGRAVDGTTNRVVIHRFLSVRSVNGPQFTAIDGGKSIRCAYLADGTALSGFTLTNGLASYGSYAYGGGVLCQSLAAVVSNCVVAGNSATGYGEGGGAYGGTLNNCTLTSNSVTGLGGGAYYCTLNNCTLAGNSAAFGGGGGG